MTTRNIVPQANEEGNIGTSTKNWLKGFFKDLQISAYLTDGTYNISLAQIYDLFLLKNGPIALLTTPVTRANLSTEGVLLSATIPANRLTLNSGIFIRANGVAGTTTTAPTMTWRARIGPTTLTGNIASSIAITPAVSQTNKPWAIDLLLNIRTIGASGTIIGNGFCQNELSTTAPNYQKGSIITATVVVNTTISNLIELTFQFSAASTSNTITIHNGKIDFLNLITL